MNYEHLICKASPIAGLGLFATMPILKGTRVIEYTGEKIDSAEMLRRCAAGNHYVLKLNETQYLDASGKRDFARFINHSCEPNCEIQWENGRVWIAAIRDISSEEEVTYNYSFDLDDYQNFPCRCGSVQCVGFIVAEEFFDHVRSQNDLRRTAQK